MKSLTDVYDKLLKEYKVEWVNEKNEAFYLYTTLNKKEYRITIGFDGMEIDVKKKIFKYTYWNTKKHFHFDGCEGNHEKIYEQVIDYIRSVNKRNFSEENTIDRIIDIIKLAFQKATLSTILLTISTVIFLLFIPQIRFDSFFIRLKYYALIFIPVAVFFVLTFFTYKGKIRESLSSFIALVLFLVGNVYYFMMVFSIVIDQIENPITNIRYYETFRHDDFPKTIPKGAENERMFYHPGLLQGGSVVGVYFKIDNEAVIKEYISKYEKIAKYTSLNYKPDNITGYEPYKLACSPYEELPEDFIIYYLEQRCDDSGYCNHGEYTIVAINDATNEIICENSNW